MERQDVLEALKRFDAGQPERLRELVEQLSTDATVAADAAMSISQNEVDERGQLLYKAAFHGLLERSEMIELTLQPFSARAG